MKILIDNAGFVNKGAELMFASIVEQLERRYPDAQLVIPERGFNAGGYEYCREHGIMVLKIGFYYRLLLCFYNLCLRMKLLKPDSPRLFVHSSQVDVIIDAAGFKFGDQWKHTSLNNCKLRRYYNSFPGRAKLILLPQSFGPFFEKKSKKAVKILLSRADMVYVREEESMKYIREITQNNLKVRFMRDFTLLHKHETIFSELMPKGEYVVFIPNTQMINRLKLKDNAYLDFMCELIQSIHSKGEKIYLLNHEGIGDKLLCEQINQKIGLNLPIISGLRAMQVKNIIAGAKLVVSSRFHGVVSGITQQVPTFCTSWSHKYNELVAVYGIENNLLDLDSVEQSVLKLEDALREPEKYIASSQIIKQEKESVEKMWTDVFDYIENK